jgi:hypothetical protein
MSNHPYDRPNPPASLGVTRSRHAARHGEVGTELGDWLQSRVLGLADEWAAEIKVRGMGHATVVDEIVARQVLQLSSMMPWLLGRHATPLQPLWSRACELFGAVAAKRGLAAGEVVEEFQILRVLIIRELYQDPLVGGAPTLRDALRLNGIVDRGVTHASVGHTDAMFFQLLEDSDAPVGLSADQIAREAEAQLVLIREEVEAIVGPGEIPLEAAAESWTSVDGGAADA